MTLDFQRKFFFSEPSLEKKSGNRGPCFLLAQWPECSSKHLLGPDTPTEAPNSGLHIQSLSELTSRQREACEGWQLLQWKDGRGS